MNPATICSLSQFSDANTPLMASFWLLMSMNLELRTECSMAYYCIVFYYTDTIDLNNLKGRDNVKYSKIIRK